MSKTKNIKRNSHYNDAKLKQLADKMLMLIQRDAPDFLAYGINLPDINDYTALLLTFVSYPTDALLESNKMVATAKRNSCRKSLETIMRYFFTVAKLCFADNPAVLASFGNSALANQTTDQLIRNAQTIANTAQRYWSPLATTSINHIHLQTLQTAITAFNEAVTEQITATNLRRTATAERIKVSNALYTLVTQIATYGKLLWQNTNYAKYNDYLLY